MSERLAAKGKVGAEEVTEILGGLFTQLLEVSAAAGGDLLSFGGDALVLFFDGEGHARRAVRAAASMRATLRRHRGIRSSAGAVQLRVSVGVHTGRFTFFVCGLQHRQLVVTGPAVTETVHMERAASAGQVVLSNATAALIADRFVDRLAAGSLLTSMPDAPEFEPEPIGPGVDPRDCLPEPIRARLDADEHDGEHRQVTVGFITYDGTDALIEAGGPEAGWRDLDALVRAAQASAAEHEVCFLGCDVDADGGRIILVAGAPTTTGRDDERMLLAVRRLLDAGLPIKLRAGVNRGHVFAGEVGASFRRTYTVMGDAVNLAARLVARVRPGQLIASLPVLERSATHFDTHLLEPFSVKGKSEPVTAAIVGGVTHADRPGRSSSLPLVGRDNELAAIEAGLASTGEGHGAVFEVVGEPGIGKSRLVEEVRSIAQGFTQLTASCGPYTQTISFFPFRNLLRTLVAVDIVDDGRAMNAALRARLESVAPELLPWLPLLALVLDVPVPSTREVDELGETFIKARLHWAVETLLRRLCPGPTLFVVEDAHWLDEASGDLVEHLLEAAADSPWTILVTRRPLADAPPPSPAVTRLELGPLDERAARDLVRRTAGARAFHSDEIEAVANRAGGNPLFLLELVGSGADVDDLPGSVEAVIAARIDELQPSDRTLLRQAAVVGMSIDAEVSAKVLGAADAAWQRLSAFVDSDERGVRFRHALFRDVAYEGLPYARRRLLHQRAAEVYEDHFAGATDDHSELLSLHYSRAHVHDKAWTYSLIAAKRARDRFANMDAAVFYRRALEAAPRVTHAGTDAVASTWGLLGDALRLAGRSDDAFNAYSRARALTRATGAPEADLLRKQGLMFEARGEYSTALRCYRRGLNASLGRPGRDEVELALAYAGVRFRQGKFRDCIAWCESVLDEAQGLDDASSLAHTYLLLHIAHVALADPRQHEFEDQALAIYESLGDLESAARVLNNLGGARYLEGRWSEAIEYYRRAEQLDERIGDVISVALVQSNIAELLCNQGHGDQAASLLIEVERVTRAARNRWLFFVARLHAGRVALRSGRLDDARQIFEEALDGFSGLGAGSYVVECEVGIAESALLRGDSQRALDLVASLMARGVTPSVEPMLDRIRGYALAQLGRQSEAVDALRASLSKADLSGSSYERALSLEALVRIGAPEAIEADVEREQLFESLGIVATPIVPLS